MKNRFFLYFVILITFLPVIYSLIYLFSIERYVAEEMLSAATSVMGLISFLILFWQYVLSSRIVISFFTKDLVNVNSLHKFLGIYGVILIFLHPVFYYSDRILSGAGIELPNLASINDRFILLGQIALFILGSIWITSAIFRSKLGFRFWKRVHLFSYIILFLVFIHGINIGFFLNDITLVWFRVYWFILFFVFLLISLSRLLAQLALIKIRYKVSGIVKQTHDTFSIKFKPYSIGSYVKPKNGQFVYVQISKSGESHPYTISSCNVQNGELEITTKNLGSFSQKLHSLKIDDEVYIDGPYGVFTKEAYVTKDPIVLVAGGIGITPFLSMFDYFIQNPEKNPGITLFYGNKTLEDIAFKENLDSLANPKLKIINVISNLESVPEGFEKGFITVDLIKKYLDKEPISYDYFLCGPPIMMDKLIPALESIGIKKTKIYTEKFSL